MNGFESECDANLNFTMALRWVTTMISITPHPKCVKLLVFIGSIRNPYDRVSGSTPCLPSPDTYFESWRFALDNHGVI